MMRRGIGLLVLGYFIISCQPTKELQEKQVFLNKEEMLINDTSLLGAGRMIPLELIDESLIRNVDKVILFENKIGIVDLSLNSLFVYDKNGKFLYKIQQMGTGPGEYVQLFDVCVDVENSRFAFLTAPNAILYYDYKGNYQEKRKLEGLVQEMSLRNDQIYLLLSDRDNYTESKYSFWILDSVANGKKEILEQSVRPVKSMWTRGRVLSTEQDGNYFLQRYTNRVYKLAGDSCQLLFRLNLGKYNLPEDMLVDDFNPEQFKERCNANEYVFSLTNLSDLKDGYLMTSNRPGFFYFDKKKEQLKHYQFIENTEYGITFSYMTPLEGEEKKIVFVLKEDQIVLMKKYKKDIQNNNLKAMLEILPQDSNPILFLYDLKEDQSMNTDS